MAFDEISGWQLLRQNVYSSPTTRRITFDDLFFVLNIVSLITLVGSKGYSRKGKGACASRISR